MQPSLWNEVRRIRATLFQWRLNSWKRRLSSMDGEHIKLVDAHEPSSDALDSVDEVLRQEEWERKRQVVAKCALVLASVALVLYTLAQLPLKAYMLETSTWIKEHTFWGTFAGILMFLIAIPLCVPSTIVEAVSGSLFGVPHGVVVILIGKTAGSLITFLIGRRVGKAVIGDYLSTKFPTFRALSEVMNGESWKPVILFQLASIPNLVKCYALAITKISGTRFAVSSAVGTAPTAFLWANIGSQASDIASILSGQSEMSNSKLVMLVGGGILTVVAMTLLVVYTKRELAELQKREYASGSEDETSPMSIQIDSGVSMQIEEDGQPRMRSNTAAEILV